MASPSLSTTQWSQSLTTEARLSIAKSLATVLETKYDSTSALLCASLLGESDAQHETQETLSQLVLQRARAGHVDDILELAHSATWLRVTLLGHIIEELVSKHPDSLISNTTAGTGEQDDLDIVHLLRCTKCLVSAETVPATCSRIILICLTFVRSNAKIVAFAARETIFAIIAASNCADDLVEEIRECITSHLLSEQALSFQHTIGFSLWLHQLLATPSLLLPYMHERSYWNLIARGLRFGDGERRKLCSEILKLSVREVALSSQIQLVTSQENVSSAVLISQYKRYCTVFETLALARYQNLLLETERDLNLLASSASVVDSRWLFVLLHTALAADMQDQNRRVVGKWLLDGHLRRPTQVEELAPFLQQSFLPWATEGHLFVSTVKQSVDRIWHCPHGERLSSFIQRSLNTDDASASTLLDVLLDYLLHGHRKLFLHAAVYIMDGITRCKDQLTPTTAQAQAILELSTWQAFPEISKEYVRRCCWTMINALEVREQHVLGQLSDRSRSQYSVLQTRFGDSGEDSTAHLSEREKKVQRALQKCVAASDAGYSGSASDLCDTFDDIWSDAEYLVYPRELLEAIPSTFLTAHAVNLSAHEETSAEQLKTFINSTLQRMLDLAENRSYVLAPLMAAVRECVLVTPRAVEVLSSLEEILLQIARSPPVPKTDLQLEYAISYLSRGQPASIVNNSSAESECRGFAAYFDLISRLHVHSDLPRSIANAIIARWKRQKVPAPTVSSWKTTLQLQVLVLCCEHLQHLDTSGIHELLDDLYFLLSVEPLPYYRYLLSWIIIRLLTRSPDQHHHLLELLQTRDHHSNPKYLAALMKLSVELVDSDKTTEDFAVQLASNFIALSASSKVVIRHEAQWSFPLLMDLAHERKWSKICDNPAYRSLDAYIRSLPRFDEPPLERVYTRFSLAKHNNLANLIEGLWTQLEHSGLPLARRTDLSRLHNHDDSRNLTLPPPCIELGDAINATKASDGQTVDPADHSTSDKMTHDEVIALQTKGTAYLKNILGDEEMSGRQHQLIVLASLVTNPYNLGGLSRVSEIFGAQALYVRDPRVITEKDFTSVAVSSHNHIGIRPLAEDDIARFLAEKRTGGWTVVGVEQTDRSDMLGMPSTSLPEKTILIIGNEREGMPGAVISECDVLVEIPQRGVTRSMNVQTVAAVVLYEFNRQHQ